MSGKTGVIAIRYLVIVIPLLLFSYAPVSAEIKTFEKEYTYQASELDSKSTCRTLALEQAKRMLLEELGVFLTSQTEVKGSALTKDQITTITAGIVSAEIVDERWDGHVYWLRAKIAADPVVVNQAIEVIRSDTKKTSELEAAQKRIETLTKELEAVKSDLGSTPQERQKRYTKIVNQKQATDWMIKFVKTFDDKKSFAENKDALDAVNHAIEIDPEYSVPYLMRAYLYGEIARDYQKGIDDITKAIKYHRPGQNTPFENTSGHYEFRALLYKRMNRLPQAVYDLMTALEMDPETIHTILKPGGMWKASDIEMLVKKYPADYRVYVFRGRFNSDFISRSDNPKAYDQAIADLKKALTMRGGSKTPVIYSLLMDAYGEKARDFDVRHFNEIDPVNHQNIVDTATRGLKVRKDKVWRERFLAARAEEYLTMKKYKLAIADYDEQISINPDYPGTYHDRAIAYKELGQYDQAIKDLTKAIELKHPTFLDWPRSAYEIRAHVYEAIGKYELAVNDYTRAFDVWEKAFGAALKEYNMGSFIAYEMLEKRGTAYRKIGNHQHAIADYLAAIDCLTTDPPSMIYEDGDTYVELKQPEDALKAYGKAIETNARNNNKDTKWEKSDTLASEYFAKVAEVYAGLQKFDLAVDSYNKALNAVDNLPPYKGKLYQDMGILYRSLGINQEAIKMLSLAVRYLPLVGEDPVFAYSELGNAYSDTGDHTEALRVFTEITKLYPNWMGGYARRGSEYYNLKDYDKAIIDFGKAIDLMPTNQFLYYYRGIALMNSGKFKQGLDDMKIAGRLGNQEAQTLLKQQGIDW